jgi:hypothetical protein
MSRESRGRRDLPVSPREMAGIDDGATVAVLLFGLALVVGLLRFVVVFGALDGG